MSLSETRRAPPEPGLTRGQMVARAVGLRAELIAGQAETERRTYYSREMHEKFVAAGFYHLYVPRRYGGYEFDVPTAFASGTPYATFYMGHALLPNPTGGPPATLLFVAPRAQWEMLDDWGTCSDSKAAARTASASTTPVSPPAGRWRQT